MGTSVPDSLATGFEDGDVEHEVDALAVADGEVLVHLELLRGQLHVHVLAGLQRAVDLAHVHEHLLVLAVGHRQVPERGGVRALQLGQVDAAVVDVALDPAGLGRVLSAVVALGVGLDLGVDGRLALAVRAVAVGLGLDGELAGVLGHGDGRGAVRVSRHGDLAVPGHHVGGDVRGRFALVGHLHGRVLAWLELPDQGDRQAALALGLELAFGPVRGVARAVAVGAGLREPDARHGHVQVFELVDCVAFVAHVELDGAAVPRVVRRTVRRAAGVRTRDAARTAGEHHERRDQQCGYSASHPGRAQDTRTHKTATP
jgi:hypothetical protein